MRRWVCLVLLVLGVGCNRGPTTTGLRGEVSFEGQAVERGTIDFIPVDGTAGPSASSPITTGRYDVAAKGGVRTDGAYQVRIIGLKKTGRMFRGHETEENFLPAKYNSDSTLKVRVSDLPNTNKVDFRLSLN
jgi:hypothetical protein